VYQDRVIVKEVPSISNSSKLADRLVIIEPSQIVDADLIRYNTSLRIVLDKKKAIYRFQVRASPYYTYRPWPNFVSMGLLSI